MEAVVDVQVNASAVATLEELLVVGLLVVELLGGEEVLELVLTTVEFEVDEAVEDDETDVEDDGGIVIEEGLLERKAYAATPATTTTTITIAARSTGAIPRVEVRK